MSSEEAYLYAAIREELTDPETTLADLDPAEVAKAQAYAKRTHKRWPPRENATDRRNRAAGYNLI